MVVAVWRRNGRLPDDIPPWLSQEITRLGGVEAWLRSPVASRPLPGRNLLLAVRAVAVPLITAADSAARLVLPRWLFAEVSRHGPRIWLLNRRPVIRRSPPPRAHPRNQQDPAPRPAPHQQSKPVATKPVAPAPPAAAKDLPVVAPTPALSLHYARGQRMNLPAQCDICQRVSSPTWHYDNSSRGAVTVCADCRAEAQQASRRPTIRTPPRRARSREPRRRRR